MPKALYDKDALGTGTAQTMPPENAAKVQGMYELVRRKMERAAVELAWHYNLRRREWSPKISDVVWAKEHFQSCRKNFSVKISTKVWRAAQGGVSPVIAVLRHGGTKKENTSNLNELKAQAEKTAGQE